MKVIKQSFVFLAAVILVVFCNAATDNTWQAVNGEWSGYWTDDAHWSLGPIGEGYTARFDLKNNGSVEVLFPSGAYTNSAEIFLRGYNTRFDITLNGTNTAYVMGGSENVAHTTRPFFPTHGNYAFNSYTYNGPLNKAPLEFTNFKIRYASLNDKFLLDFDGGDYNFYNPCGTVLTSPVLNFFTMTLDSFSPNRIVCFKDATVKCGALNISCGENGTVASTNLFLLENSDMTVASTLFFPLSSDGSAGWQNPSVTEIRLDNSSLTVNGFSLFGKLKNGVCANKKFILTVDNESTLSQTGNDFASSDSHYVINILNGSQMLLNRSVYFGRDGTGTTEVNVINTDWSSQGSTMYIGPPTESAASYPTMRTSLNISNSTFSVKNHLRFTSADFNIIDSTVEGNDFAMDDPDIAVAKLHVNGGKYRFTSYRKDFNGDLLHDWDEASVGSRGFIVENACVDCTVSQAFSDAADQAGVLTFTGSKAFTLSSDNTTVSTLVIAGTSVAFSDGALYKSSLVVTNGAAVSNLPASGLTGLKVGDGDTVGTVEIDFTKNVVIDGTVSFDDAQFTYVGTFEKGVKATVLTANQADESTIAFWKAIAATFEMPEMCGAVYDVVNEDGKYFFTITVRDRLTHNETLVDGESTNSENYIFDLIDYYISNVGPGANLTLAGELKLGRFEKRGLGCVELTNPANKFALGFGLYEGVLSATSAQALGYTGNGSISTLYGGALDLRFESSLDFVENPIEVDAQASPVVINVATPAAMRPWAGKAGSVIKTGAGALSLVADGVATVTASDGEGVTVRDTRLVPEKPIAFAENGTFLSGAYAGLTVLEGELRVAGEGTVNAKNTFAIGGPMADLSRAGAQVGLVVDGVTLDTRNPPGGLAFATAMKLGTTVPAAMNMPYLYVTNAANLICHNFFALSLSSGTDDVKLAPVVLVDNSTMEMKSAFQPNGSGDPLTVCPEWTVRNGSRLYAASDMSINGSSKFVFDGAELAKNSAGGALKIVVVTSRTGTSNEFSFVNGSLLRCHTICFSGTQYVNIPFVLSFDSSQWYPGPGSFEFHPTNLNLRVVAEGEGLVLAPGNGCDYLWRHDLSGSGGLVKRGEGSLTINAANMLYGGLTKVEEGTLDLDGSLCAGKSFAGSGTIANGTLSSPTFSLLDAEGSVSGGALKVSGDVQIEGTVKVDLGRSSAEYPGAGYEGESFEVISYEGSAPDVSKWRLRRSGYRGVRGVFSAGDGVVSCSIVPSGATIIVK